MPLYLIAPKDAPTGTKPRLVRARTQAAGLRHIARDSYSVETASADDVADAMAAGVKLEEAGSDPADAEQLDLPALPQA